MVSINKKDLLQYLLTVEMKCAYPCVVFFAAIKLRDELGWFNKELLIDFFVEFYKTGQEYRISLDEDCNLPQKDNLTEVMQFIEEMTLNPLLKTGILETPFKFHSHISQAVFEKEKEILSLLKNRLFSYYLENLRDRDITLRLFPKDMGYIFLKEIALLWLSDWEKKIDELVKLDATKKLAECYTKIKLDYLLKYLYQSYSLQSMNKLLNYFHITQHEIDTYFSGEIDYSKLDVVEKMKYQVMNSSLLEEREIEPEVLSSDPEVIPLEPEESVDFLIEPPVLPSPESTEVPDPRTSPVQKVKILTDFYAQMSEVNIEDDYYHHKRQQLARAQKEKKTSPSFFTRLKARFKK